MAQQPKINGGRVPAPRPSWMWIYGAIILFIAGYWLIGPSPSRPVTKMFFTYVSNGISYAFPTPFHCYIDIIW